MVRYATPTKLLQSVRQGSASPGTAAAMMDENVGGGVAGRGAIVIAGGGDLRCRGGALGGERARWGIGGGVA